MSNEVIFASLMVSLIVNGILTMFIISQHNLIVAMAEAVKEQ